jgi:hypothetical protein
VSSEPLGGPRGAHDPVADGRRLTEVEAELARFAAKTGRVDEAAALYAEPDREERCPSEPRVTRPEFEPLESRGGQEVSVDPADPDARETVSLDGTRSPPRGRRQVMSSIVQYSLRPVGFVSLSAYRESGDVPKHGSEGAPEAWVSPAAMSGCLR